MQALTTQLRYSLWRKARQAKFHKEPHYPAIPYFVKPNFIDIHDTYTKRSLEEIREEVKDKEFDIYYERLICEPGDYHKLQKEQKAVAVIDIEQFEFS